MTSTEAGVLVNKQAGLIGVSGTSSDMRDLLEREATDANAEDAIALYCYIARKAIGALTAALGGLDLLVFTGGIGQHAVPVRERICARLEFLGIELDSKRNDNHDQIISRETSKVTVRVMQTDEESIIARHMSRLVAAEGDAHVPV